MYSCAEEKEFFKDENRKVIQFEQKTLDEVLQISTFNKAYQKLVKKNAKIGNSALAKSALEEEHDFTIVPDVVKIVTSEDGTVSYNMLIEREGLTTSYFENLVLQNDTLNNTDAFLIKYTPSETMNAIPYHDSFSFEGTTEAEQIVTSGKMFFLPGGCVLITNTLCYYLVFDNPDHPEWALPHPPSSQCTSVRDISTTSQLICPTILGGGGNTNPTTSGGTVNGGTTTNNTNGLGASGGGTSPINIATVPCNGCLEEVEVGPDPCSKVNKLHQDYPNLKNALINLAATKTQSHENGIYIDSSPTSPSIQNLTFGSAAQGASINLPSPSGTIKYKMVAHTHDATGPTGTGTFSIFSWVDLSRIAELIIENHIDEAFVIYCVTADNTQYALTIDSPSSFAEHFDIKTPPDGAVIPNYYNGVKAKNLYDESKLFYSDTPKPNRITLTSSPEEDKLIFMKMIKELKLKISLYDVDPNFENHSKLSLTNGVVIATPCN